MELVDLYFLHFDPAVAVFVVMLCFLVGDAVGDCLSLFDSWRNRK